MPWHISRSPVCSPDEPYAVVNSNTGAVVSCHASVVSAEDHVAALYANVEDARSVPTTAEVETRSDDDPLGDDEDPDAVALEAVLRDALLEALRWQRVRDHLALRARVARTRWPR